MTNDVFYALSEAEKANKIKTVLRQRTEDFLTDSEIEMIIKSVRLKTQYCVMVFEDPYKFCGYISLLPFQRTKTVFGGVIAGMQNSPDDLFCRSRAVAVVNDGIEGTDLMGHIVIYIPQKVSERSRQNEQGPKK